VRSHPDVSGGEGQKEGPQKSRIEERRLGAGLLHRSRRNDRKGTNERASQREKGRRLERGGPPPHDEHDGSKAGKGGCPTADADFFLKQDGGERRHENRPNEPYRSRLGDRKEAEREDGNS